MLPWVQLKVCSKVKSLVALPKILYCTGNMSSWWCWHFDLLNFSGSVLKHRQVRHFGYEFQYSSNSVDKEHQLNQGIPPALSHIVKRITDRGCMPLPPNQLTVNRYLPGHGEQICLLFNSLNILLFLLKWSTGIDTSKETFNPGIRNHCSLVITAHTPYD